METKGNDGFPDGDPDTFGQNDQEEGDADSGSSKKKKTLNMIEIIHSIRDKLKAAIYSVACEPDLSCNSDFAHDFMRYIAEYTKGRFLPLSSAKLLPEVIVGSVKQQINLNQLKNNLDKVITEIKQEHGEDISADKLNKIIMQKWKEAGVKKKEISIGTLYRQERSRENIELLMNAQKIKSLKDFKANAKMLDRLKRSDFRHLDKGKSKKKGVATYDRKSFPALAAYSETDEDDDDDLEEDEAVYSTSGSDEDDSSSAESSSDDGHAVKKLKKKKKKKKKEMKMKKIPVNSVKFEKKEEEEESSAPYVGTFGGGDSDSDASQAYYSEECSLGESDIAEMMR